MLDLQLQELRDTCLQLRNEVNQLRDDVDQCGVALDALRAARQRSEGSIASLAHLTGWQIHAHRAQLDRLERYVIADFYESAPREPLADEEAFSGTSFRLSLSPPR